MMNRQRGSILPLTLIILAILSILAINMNVKSRHAISDVQDQKQQFSDLLAIKNAINKSLFIIAVGKQSENAYSYKGQIVYVDGQPQTIDGVPITIQDTAGILSLALSSQQEIYNVLRSYVPGDIANNITKDIIAWRTPNNLTSTPFSGDDDNYLPRHSYMRSIDELLDIPGIAQGQFYNSKNGKIGLSDDFLAGGAGWINYATMPPRLLKAIYNISDSDIDQLSNLKKSNDWPAFNQRLLDLGLYNEMNNQKSGRFVIIAKGNTYKAKGIFHVIYGGLPPIKTQLWQYPHVSRY